MHRRSPLPIRIVAFPPMLISRVLATSEVSPSSSRPRLIQVLCPSPPGAPPSRPYGARVRRYWGTVKNLHCRVKKNFERLPQIEWRPVTAPRTRVPGPHLLLHGISRLQKSPRAVQSGVLARDIVAQATQRHRSVCSLCACGPPMFRAS